jgi:hypothetical protein
MAGNQELHALAQDEFIGHALAIAVTRIHQSLQQIVAGRFVAALLDVFEQNGVRAGSHVFVFAKLARDGEPGIQIGLKGLPNDEFLDRADRTADKIDVSILQACAKKRSRDHRESDFHQVGVDIDGTTADLSIEIPQRFGERVLHDRGERIELLSIESRLDETPLRTPGFSVRREKTFSQEVAHALYLNFGFLVVLRIGFQYVLNHNRIDGNYRLLETTNPEPECVAEDLVVPGQHLHGITGHGARIHKAAKSGNNGDRR